MLQIMREKPEPASYEYNGGKIMVKCIICGKEMNPVESLLNKVCGKCVDKKHKKETK